MPHGIATAWAEGDEVALQSVQELPDGTPLKMLVEKDFQCLHKGEEAKDPDAYPNPEASPSGE